MVAAVIPKDSKRADIGSAVYSLAEYAALWDMSYTKAHEMAQAGTLTVTPIKVGRTYKFPKAVVDRMLGIEPGVCGLDDAA